MRESDEGKLGLRCRPGDLAIVTKCGVPERIGLLVRVIESCMDGFHDWRVEFIGPRRRGLDVKSGRARLCKFALARDASLTPVKAGDCQDEEFHHLYCPADQTG